MKFSIIRLLKGLNKLPVLILEMTKGDALMVDVFQSEVCCKRNSKEIRSVALQKLTGTGLRNVILNCSILLKARILDTPSQLQFHESTITAGNYKDRVKCLSSVIRMFIYCFL